MKERKQMDNKSGNGFTMTEEQVQALEQNIKLLMHMCRAIYLSAIEAGFTESHALELAKTHLEYMSKNK